MTHERIATCRIQLTPDFGFQETAEIVADLAALGVSHLYLSPVAEAVEASTHGYDVVRPWEVRAELGGLDGLRFLARAVRDAGMGLVLDVVPNHVATSQPERNPWWWQLLAEGSGSAVTTFFDIDWEHGDGQVIVPTLGEPRNEVIASGELRVEGDRVHYYDKAFPLSTSPSSVAPSSDFPPDANGGSGGDERATKNLTELLGRQHYRLSHWRDPNRNVRRFFTIDDLVAIRPEVPQVADAVIAIAEELAADGLLDGVRLDHIDGLAEPGAYLEDLRGRMGEQSWLLVEKIVVGDETLSSTWPVQGTTGYEWIRMADHLFTNPAGHSAFREPLGLPGQPSEGSPQADGSGYHAVETTAIREVLRGELLPDLERVARATAAALEDRATSTSTSTSTGTGTGTGTEAVDPTDLVDPLIELTAQLGRYRTYLPTDLSGSTGGEGAGTGAADHPDRKVVESAAERAGELLDPTARVLLGPVVELILEGTEVTRRWQQLSGPALAKGGEDRSLYRWIRLSAHNEVGGDPGSWTTTLEGFHAHNAEVSETHPYTLLAGSTHDTKRSEDTRARLLALTEVPELWAGTVAEWTEALRGLDTPLETIAEPALTLGLQTVVAVWPVDARRLGDYFVKAAREAHLRTSWTDPVPEHEDALHQLAGILTSDGFAPRVKALVETVEPLAHSISLAQLTLRLTAPGVPDLYQGSEGWLHTLVDPDNRRPIDVDVLRERIRGAGAMSPWESATPKASLIARVLTARAATPECFGAGSRYQPLRARGEHADHVVAFVRMPSGAASRSTPSPDASGATEASERGVVTVVARFPASHDDWENTSIDLPDGNWQDVLDDRPHGSGPTLLTDLLGSRPASVLAMQT